MTKCAKCGKLQRVALWAVKREIHCTPCMESMLNSGRAEIEDIQRLTDNIDDFEILGRGRKRKYAVGAST